MGFILGFIIGLIVSPLLLALISKPLMIWLAKRQASKLMSNVSERLSGLQNQLPIKEQDGTREEESSESNKDRSSEGATSTGC